MQTELEFYKIFKPELSPKKMLEYGVFGGSYLGNTLKEYPKEWFKKAKLSKKKAELVVLSCIFWYIFRCLRFVLADAKTASKFWSF